MKVQEATAGMTLTNGEVYAKIVYLPDEAVNWVEIPDSEVPDTSEELTTEPQPTLEERVSDIEQVTTEVITALNDKGIVP